MGGGEGGRWGLGSGECVIVMRAAAAVPARELVTMRMGKMQGEDDDARGAGDRRGGGGGDVGR